MPTRLFSRSWCIGISQTRGRGMEMERFGRLFTWRAGLGILLAFLILWVLALRPKTPPPPPPLTVGIAPQHPVMNLPVYLAERIQPSAFRLASGAEPNALRIGPAGSAWPILGVVAQRSDAVLIAPEPDPHFRLAQLNQLPVAYEKGRPLLLHTTELVLHLHRVNARLEALSPPHLDQLWRLGTLPFAVVDLPTLVELSALKKTTTVLAPLAASTGPVTAWVMTGSPANAEGVLHAINLSLWYLKSHSTTRVGEVLNGADGLSAVQWQRLAELGQKYRIWPGSTLPQSQLYQRLKRLEANLAPQSPWPPYAQAVDTAAALKALSLKR